MVDYRQCRRILAVLTAFKGAIISCPSFGTSDLQSVVRGIMPGFDDVSDIQTFDAGAGVTEPGENGGTDRGLAVPGYLSFDPVLSHQVKSQTAFALAAFLI
jgi:hypothetical protein